MSKSLEKLLFFLFIPVLLLGFWLRTNQLQLYPPGISNDEAINTVDAFHFATTGTLSLYEENEGREPLFRVIQGLGLLAFGKSVWALRLVSVLSSMPFLTATIWLTREYLHDYPPHIRWLASLLAGLVLATMIGNVTLSRTIYRGVLFYLTMSLSIAFVLRGLRKNRWRDYVISGIFGGISLYTYTAAWFFPFSFVVLSAGLLIFKFRVWKQWLPKMMGLGMVAAVVCIPIIYLLLVNPNAVFVRADTVSSSAGGSLLSKLKVLQYVFLVSGDPNPQYNADIAALVPYMFTWLFYAGFVGLLVRLRKAESWFLFSIFVLMLFPALFSDEITHGLRISGEHVIIPVIIGIGCGLILWGIDKVLQRPAILTGVVLIIICYGGYASASRTWTRYTIFYDNPDQWRLWDVHEMQLNHNEWFFRVDRQDFREWVSNQERPMLIPVEEVDKRSTRSWLMGAYPETTSVDGDYRVPDYTILVMPWSLERGDLMRDTRHFALLDNGVITFLPPLSSESHHVVMETIDEGTAITREGQIDFLGYWQEIEHSDVQFEEPQITDENLAIFANGDMRLSGWYGDMNLTPGQPYEFSLEWEALRRIGHSYITSVQLLTQNYERISSRDDYIMRWAYPTIAWDLNLPVSNYQILDVPEDLASGAYRLSVGLTYPIAPLVSAESESLPVLDNLVTFAWLKVAQEASTIPPSAYPIEVTIADMFQLTHVEFAVSGDGLLLGQLHWQSLMNRPNVDATIFVHIVNSDGDIVAQSDTRPLGGQYPTFIWDEYEIVRTDHAFNFSDFENLDDYTVRVGMYTFPGPVNLTAEYEDRRIEDGLVNIGYLSDFFTD